MRNRSSGARNCWLSGLILVLGVVIASLVIGATAAAQAPPDSEFEKVTLNDSGLSGSEQVALRESGG